ARQNVGVATGRKSHNTGSAATSIQKAFFIRRRPRHNQEMKSFVAKPRDDGIFSGRLLLIPVLPSHGKIWKASLYICASQSVKLFGRAVNENFQSQFVATRQKKLAQIRNRQPLTARNAQQPRAPRESFSV